MLSSVSVTGTAHKYSLVTELYYAVVVASMSSYLLHMYLLVSNVLYTLLFHYYNHMHV